MNCRSRIIYNEDCNLIINELDYDYNYVYAYILQQNKILADEIQTYVYIRTQKNDKVIFDVNSDGFYTLATIKVSKSEEEEYYYKNGNFYHNGMEVSLEILSEMNPETSGLDIEHEYYFHTCHLRQCFVNICEQILNQVEACNKNSIDYNLSYKRDLLWSALNVIDYLSEQEKFEEAERLLERIMSCNGLCDSYKTSCNCKCS